MCAVQGFRRKRARPPAQGVTRDGSNTKSPSTVLLAHQVSSELEGGANCVPGVYGGIPRGDRRADFLPDMFGGDGLGLE